MNQASTIIGSYIVKTREVEYLKRQYIEKLDQLEKLEKLYLQTINKHEPYFTTTQNECQNVMKSSVKTDKELIKCSNCDHELFHLDKHSLNSENKDDYLILFPKLNTKIDHTINIETKKSVIKSESLTIDLNDKKIRRIINKESRNLEYEKDKSDSKNLPNSCHDNTNNDAPNPKGHSRSKKICSYCGESGHKRAQCHKRLNSERGI